MTFIFKNWEIQVFFKNLNEDYKYKELLIIIILQSPYSKHLSELVSTFLTPHNQD